jgi:hypothetical protein
LLLVAKKEENRKWEEAKAAAAARVQARLEAKKGTGKKGRVAACCLSLTNTSMEYGLKSSNVTQRAEQKHATDESFRITPSVSNYKSL